MQSKKIDYQSIYKKFNIICNNSVHFGDCRGETMCLCMLTDVGLKIYYNKSRAEIPIIHEDYFCKKCDIKICGCCYEKCPSCNPLIK